MDQGGADSNQPGLVNVTKRAYPNNFMLCSIW